MSFELFNFNGDFSPLKFKIFFKYCHDNSVSDITIQGGDYIWVEIFGRQIQATPHIIQQAQMPIIVSAIWSTDINSYIRSGKGADRSLEISGEEIGVPRWKPIRFRCNFIQGQVAHINEAYSITMRIIPNTLPDLAKLNIENDLFNSFYPSMGLVLVCGPTGSGKTTLLAGIYAHVGKYMPDRKVVTYEDPVEFILGGTHWKGVQPSQSQIGKDIENFALGLRNAMRRKPSIIGIGEARDLETIDAMLEASLSGHLTFATIHAHSVSETINRIIQVYPPASHSSIASRLLGTLQVIVVQRLLKTLDGKRCAIREYLIFDRELKNKLQQESYEKWAFIIRNLLETKHLTLIDKAYGLLKNNIIDKQEFITIAGSNEFTKRQGGKY